MQMVRLVLFDIDGTLIQTGGAGMRAFGRAFASEFGLLHGIDSLRFAGRTDTSLVREFFLKHHVEPSEPNYQRFFDSYVFWLDHLVRELNGQLCPGVLHLLDELEKLTPAPVVGLLTGNIRLGAEIKLRHFHIWHRFSMGAFGNDHEERNELAVIAKARGEEILKTRLKGSEVLVIGDTPLDIACARAIDAKVLAVATGNYSMEELEEHLPTWTCPHLEAVKATQLCEANVKPVIPGASG